MKRRVTNAGAHVTAQRSNAPGAHSFPLESELSSHRRFGGNVVPFKFPCKVHSTCKVNAAAQISADGGKI